MSSGNRILAATERLQLWAPPLADALIEEEDGQMIEDRPHPTLNDWNCVWQCKCVFFFASLHMVKLSKSNQIVFVTYTVVHGTVYSEMFVCHSVHYVTGRNKACAYFFVNVKPVKVCHIKF